MWQTGGMPGATKPKPSHYSEAVGNILRARKAFLHVTDVQIAHAVGISRSQVGGILNAEKHVDIEQLDRICYALDLRLADVIKQADEATAGRASSTEWPARMLSGPKQQK